MQLGIPIDFSFDFDLENLRAEKRSEHSVDSQVDSAIGLKPPIVDEAGCKLHACETPLSTENGVLIYLSDLLDLPSGDSIGSSFGCGRDNSLSSFGPNHIPIPIRCTFPLSTCVKNIAERLHANRQQ